MIKVVLASALHQRMFALSSNNRGMIAECEDDNLTVRILDSTNWRRSSITPTEQSLAEQIRTWDGVITVTVEEKVTT